MGFDARTDGEHPDRIVAVDLLRGIAVLLVMWAHLPFSRTGLGGSLVQSGAGTFPGPLFQHVAGYGAYGVHLFLVISGFCIHLRWVRARDPAASVDFVGFWKRRLARLYPVYLVALAASLLAIFVVHGLLLGGIRSPSIGGWFGYASDARFVVDLLALLFLVQNLGDASQRIGNGPFWSLALEEQLYALYFPLLWMRKRYGWRAVFVVTSAVSVAWRLGGWALLGPEARAWQRIGPSFWVAWALGAWAVEAHEGTVETPRWLLGPAPVIAALLACAAWRPPVPGWRPLPGADIGADIAFAALGFLFLLHVCRWLETRPRGGWLARTLHGLWSYSL